MRNSKVKIGAVCAAVGVAVPIVVKLIQVSAIKKHEKKMMDEATEREAEEYRRRVEGEKQYDKEIADMEIEVIERKFAELKARIPHNMPSSKERLALFEEILSLMRDYKKTPEQTEKVSTLYFNIRDVYREIPYEQLTREEKVKYYVLCK